MEIKVLASSSQGNCYIVSDGKNKIMLECGIAMRNIRRGGDFCVHEVSGCLLSHEH